MGLRFSKAIVGVDDEATPYTYGEPVAVDSFAAFDIAMSFSGDNYIRQETKAHYGRLPELAGIAEGEISFKIPAMGSGVAPATPTAPYYWKALQGAGLKQNIVAATNVNYTPASTFDGPAASSTTAGNPDESYSVSVWVDGVKYSIKGAVGNVVLSGKIGEPWVWEFNFKGAYEAKITDAAPTITLPTPTPIPFMGANVIQVHSGYNAILESMSLDMGNELGRVVNANDASGLRGYTIINRRPMIKFNPEDVIDATHNFWSIWRAASQSTINIDAVGSGAGNLMAWTATNTQYHAPGVGNREGSLILDMEAAIVTTGAEGSEFSITFT